MKVYITSQGDVLDEIIFRHYGFIEGAIEAVYHANFGLAELGLVLEADIKILFPDLSEPVKREQRIWG